MYVFIHKYTVIDAEVAIQRCEVEKDKKVNINMIAAFTHLTADSLRTLSIFLAAIVSVAGRGGCIQRNGHV
jgi:hypothetical protein